MNKKKIALSLAVAVSLNAVSLCAAENMAYDLEEIIVHADAQKPAVDTENVLVKQVSPGKASSVPEILRQVAGIDIQMRTPGDSQDGTVKLRGFDARRFTLLIDGRPVMMAGVMGGNYVDWNAIPLDMVDKIQIIKGGKGAAYGNTLGGVINIITKEQRENGGNISLLVGGNGQYQRLFNYGGRTGKMDWKIHTNQFGSDGVLKNNDYAADQYGLGLKYKVTDKDSLAVNLSRTIGRRGMIIGNQPGTPGYDPSYPVISAKDSEFFSGGGPSIVPGGGAYWKKYVTNYDTTWQHTTDHGSMALSYWKNQEKRQEVNYKENKSVWFDRTIVSDESQGWQLFGKNHANGHTYGYGIDYKEMRYGYGWYTLGSGMDLYPSQKINVLGSYLEDTWVLDNRWTGNMGLRYDKMSGRPDDKRSKTSSVDYDGISPKLNFSFRNNKETTTFLSVNRLWRAPSMAEFYWWSDNNSNPKYGAVGGGKTLKPETGWGYELGFSHQVSSKFTTKLTGYYQDIADYINFTHQFPFSCYNIDKAQVWGFEWENSYQLTPQSRLLLNYTNQHTRKEGVSPIDHLGLAGQLDYRPRHKASFGYQYDAKPWQVRYDVSYTGSQVANYPYGSDKVVAIGGYVLHNFSLVRDVGKESTVAVHINNLFAKDHVEQYNYPLTGRVFSLSFNQKI